MDVVSNSSVSSTPSLALEERIISIVSVTKYDDDPPDALVLLLVCNNFSKSTFIAGVVGLTQCCLSASVV